MADVPRQRTRVGGAGAGVSSSSNSAGNLSAIAPPPVLSAGGSPSPKFKVQQQQHAQQQAPQQTYDVPRPSSGKQSEVAAAAAAGPLRTATPPAAAAPRPASSPTQPSYTNPIPAWKPQQQAPAVSAEVSRPSSAAARQVRVEAAAPSSRATTPQAAAGGGQAFYSSSSVPEPPAPRSWTPSKLGTSSGGGSGTTTRSMTPAEALEREMQELACVEPAGPSSSSTHQQQQQQRPHSSNTAGGMAAYKNPYYDSGVGGGAAAGGASVGIRPASSGGSPLIAQHNNLMSPAGGGSGSGRRPGSGSGFGHSWEDFPTAQAGTLAKIKGRLGGRSDECSSTAVEAFTDAGSSSGVVAGDSSDSVIVARRRGTAPARLQPSTCSRTTAEWEQEATALLSSGDRLAVLQLAGPSSGVARCYVKRISNILGMGQHFELRLEATDECLAIARRRVKSASSSYVIGLTSGGCSSGTSTPSSSHEGGSGSAVGGSLRRDDPEVVAKLKANMLGTEYLLRGRGGDATSHKGFNAQLLAVNYKPTVNHVQTAPRTMTAILPIPGSKVWDGSQQCSSGQFESLTGCMEAARERQLPPSQERDLVMLHTMKPHFDAVKQVHYLDFKGRVHEVSLKNFQLVHWDHNRNQLGTDLVLLFGKKEHSEYAVDFCYPMNALQAFALGLSSIDSKLCYAV